MATPLSLASAPASNAAAARRDAKGLKNGAAAPAPIGRRAFAQLANNGNGNGNGNSNAPMGADADGAPLKPQAQPTPSGRRLAFADITNNKGSASKAGKAAGGDGAVRKGKTKPAAAAVARNAAPAASAEFEMPERGFVDEGPAPFVDPLVGDLSVLAKPPKHPESEVLPFEDADLAELARGAVADALNLDGVDLSLDLEDL
jgi:hypothetical protein